MKKPFILLALAVLCCIPAAAQRRAAWNKVASAEELTGLWEGAMVMEIPANKEAGLPRSSVSMVITLNHESAGPITIHITADMGRYLDDVTAIPAMKAAGITKDQLWSMILSEIQTGMEGLGFDGYGILFSFTSTEEEILADESLMLNRERTRLKITFPDRITLGMGDKGFTEIILSKMGGGI